MFHRGQPVILPKPAEYAREGSRGTAAEDLELTENPAKPGFRYERAQRVYRSINVSHATRLVRTSFTSSSSSTSLPDNIDDESMSYHRPLARRHQGAENLQKIDAGDLAYGRVTA
jgi:hypothetical protein